MVTQTENDTAVNGINPIIRINYFARINNDLVKLDILLAGDPVERPVEVLDWDAGRVEKGGYRHFMLKEIFEQPKAIANAFRGRLSMDAPRWKALWLPYVTAKGGKQLPLERPDQQVLANLLKVMGSGAVGPPGRAGGALEILVNGEQQGDGGCKCLFHADNPFSVCSNGAKRISA